MNVFVYGTLKRGGALHNNIKKEKYLGLEKLSGFQMYEMGWFPAVKKADEDSFIYGEVYSVSKECLKVLDEIEGKGVLYEREKVDTKFGKANLYVYSDEIDLANYPLVAYGYFTIFAKHWCIRLSDRKYEGDASKIVFDMRFFDTSAGRCDTNREYMRLCKYRTFDLDINTSVEDVFLTDLVLHNKIEEM
jgi:gamma-glutamylcyclotransferase (GGCT)/AIG2-like uncharacterized protein YtfP|tara:strand:+ start:552 stop:1121 length:570 start_codon:yes stop_codon:yes gene_type:complete